MMVYVIIANCSSRYKQPFLIYKNKFLFIKHSGRSCVYVSGVFIFVSTIFWLDCGTFLRVVWIFFFLLIINHFILYYLFILLFACIFYCLKIQCFSINRNGERQLVWNPYLQGIRGGHDFMVVELISTFAMSVYSPLNIHYWCIDGKYRIYVARFRLGFRYLFITIKLNYLFVVENFIAG
jgi:hypothetical protein